MSVAWNPDFTARSPIFEPLHAVAQRLHSRDWPGCDDLNATLLASGAQASCPSGGPPLSFVEQSVRRQKFEDAFEPRIFLRGEVQLRNRNWHDLFNALVWLTFPMAKTALNRRHYRELERERTHSTSNRGSVRDALTLFDEGGVVVAASDPELAALLTGYKWKELFWRRRAEVTRAMRFYVFGHALYEKALAPFAGMTGRGVILEVGNGFFDVPLAAQINALDLRLAVQLEDAQRFCLTRELAPIPILGIPGWCPDNMHEQYYDDTSYFRPAPANRLL